MVALAFACACATSTRERATERSAFVYLGAGMAGRNNPNHPSGDSDNLAVALGARLPLGSVSLRPELHAGDHSVQFTPSLTWDFPVAGRGVGAIEGQVGLGFSWLTQRENNVLGNTSSPFVRLGFEGSLELGLVAGAALMVAPWGYDGEDVAVAGIAYFGFGRE